MLVTKCSTCKYLQLVLVAWIVAHWTLTFGLSFLGSPDARASHMAFRPYGWALRAPGEPKKLSPHSARVILKNNPRLNADLLGTRAKRRVVRISNIYSQVRHCTSTYKYWSVPSI